PSRGNPRRVLEEIQSETLRGVRCCPEGVRGSTRRSAKKDLGAERVLRAELRVRQLAQTQADDQKEVSKITKTLIRGGVVALFALSADQKTPRERRAPNDKFMLPANQASRAARGPSHTYPEEVSQSITS